MQSPNRSRRSILLPLLFALAAMTALVGCGAEEKGPKLALTAAVPSEVPDGTVLRVGDPATETALKASGLIDDLDIEIEWANITGGPKTLEAFRADAIDVGSVADIPPLFAQWTGTDVKIIAARETVDPLEHPTYELGIAPGVDVKTLAGPQGQEDRLQPRPGPGCAGAARARQGRPDPGRRRAGRDGQRRRRLLARAERQAGRRRAARPVAGRAATSRSTSRTAPPRSSPRCATTRGRSTRRPRCSRTRNKAAALKSYVEAWAKAQQWISEQPGGVRAGLLRRARGPAARGRELHHRGARRVRGADQLGRRPSPATRRRPTCSRRSRTASTSTWPTSTTAATRRRSPRRSEPLVTAVLDRPLVRDPVDERVVRTRLRPGRRIPFGFWIGPVALLALWFIGSATGLLDERTLSAPWTVVATAGDLIADGRLQESIATSAVRAGLGLALGVVIGVVLAIASGLSRVGESLIDGPVQVKRSIPSLALIPLLILWLGHRRADEDHHHRPRRAGARLHPHPQRVARDRREVRRAGGDRRPEPVRVRPLGGAARSDARLPARACASPSPPPCSPSSWSSRYNATSGIGHLITLASNYGQTDVIVVGLVVYAVLGLIADSGVRLIERKALAWRRTLEG